ncbi:MAG: hypothetical protein C0402_02425 [Thermodesulfovibrio sp.]|nr:hypothetical protein [Thermodesulfovibrio sp.]
MTTPLKRARGVREKYPEQRIMVIGINNYAYLIPYVEDEEELFLKTIIPSRKATESYFGGKKSAGKWGTLPT